LLIAGLGVLLVSTAPAGMAPAQRGGNAKRLEVAASKRGGPNRSTTIASTTTLATTTTTTTTAPTTTQGTTTTTTTLGSTTLTGQVTTHATTSTTTTTTIAPTTTATTGSKTPMWHADADTDFDFGDNTLYLDKQVDSGVMSRLSIVNDPKGLHGKVYKASLLADEINDGENRAEFSEALMGDADTELELGVDSSAAGSTKEIYFGWKSLFGGDVAIDEGSSNDGNYLQLKGDSSCGGPAIGMTIKYGRLTLRSEKYLTEYDGRAWNGPLFSSLMNMQYHSFVLHVRFSKDASEGFLEVWLDGVRQTMSNGKDRIHFPTMCPNDTFVYPKLGVYGMDVGIGAGPSHWFESPRIGATFESVRP
jgi:hypothetical protein